MSLGFEFAGAVALAAIAAAGFAARFRTRRGAPAPQTQHAAPQVVQAPSVRAPVPVHSGEVEVVRPRPNSIEGLEVRYGRNALVRAARVGAMNAEHKELLLTMDEEQWNGLPNAQKQEVIAAARATWAEKMCGDGPDIAYVIVQTPGGEVVGRASPHSVTVL